MAAGTGRHSTIIIFGRAGTSAVAGDVDPVVGCAAGGAGGSSIVACEAGVAAGQRHAGSRDGSLLDVATVALACVEGVEEAGGGTGEAGGVGG